MKKILLSISFFLIFGSVYSFAQVNTTVKTTIGTLMAISKNAGGDEEFLFTTPSELTTGIQKSTLQLTAISNVAYKISVKATAFTRVTGSGPVPDLGILSVGIGSATPVSLSIQDQEIFSGEATENLVHTVKYKMTPGISSPVGQFTANVTYTITEP